MHCHLTLIRHDLITWFWNKLLSSTWQILTVRLKYKTMWNDFVKQQSASENFDSLDSMTYKIEILEWDFYNNKKLRLSKNLGYIFRRGCFQEIVRPTFPSKWSRQIELLYSFFKCCSKVIFFLVKVISCFCQWIKKKIKMVILDLMCI